MLNHTSWLKFWNTGISDIDIRRVQILPLSVSTSSCPATGWKTFCSRHYISFSVRENKLQSCCLIVNNLQEMSWVYSSGPATVSWYFLLSSHFLQQVGLSETNKKEMECIQSMRNNAIIFSTKKPKKTVTTENYLFL